MCLSCVSNTQYNETDKDNISTTTLRYAISKWEGCFNCSIKYLFLGVEGKTLDNYFLSEFEYPGLIVASQENTESNCEKGIVKIETQERGFAFSIFEIKNIGISKVKVKWGHWYSCKKYGYSYATLVKKNGKWQVKSTSEHS